MSLQIFFFFTYLLYKEHSNDGKREGRKHVSMQIKIIKRVKVHIIKCFRFACIGMNMGKSHEEEADVVLCITQDLS